MSESKKFPTYSLVSELFNLSHHTETEYVQNRYNPTGGGSIDQSPNLWTFRQPWYWFLGIDSWIVLKFQHRLRIYIMPTRRKQPMIREGLKMAHSCRKFKRLSNLILKYCESGLSSIGFIFFAFGSQARDPGRGCGFCTAAARIFLRARTADEQK